MARALPWHRAQPGPVPAGPWQPGRAARGAAEGWKGKEPAAGGKSRCNELSGSSGSMACALPISSAHTGAVGHRKSHRCHWPWLSLVPIKIAGLDVIITNLGKCTIRCVSLWADGCTRQITVAGLWDNQIGAISRLAKQVPRGGFWYLAVSQVLSL